MKYKKKEIWKCHMFTDTNLIKANELRKILLLKSNS